MTPKPVATSAKARRQWPPWEKIRDGILFFCGLLLIANEAVFVKEPRGLMIGIAGAMLGYPFAALGDRIRRNGNGT